VRQTGPWNNSEEWESQGLPMGLWDRQDPGTTPRSGSSEYPRDSQWDCRTDRTLGQLQGVGVLEISQRLLMGLWDRQDPGTTPRSGMSSGHAAMRLEYLGVQ